MALATSTSEITSTEITAMGSAMAHYQHQTLGLYSQSVCSQQLGMEKYAREQAEVKLSAKEKECQRHLAQLTHKGRLHKEDKNLWSSEKAALLRQLEALQDEHREQEETIAKHEETIAKQEEWNKKVTADYEDCKVLFINSQEQSKARLASVEMLEEEKKSLQEEMKSLKTKVNIKGRESRMKRKKAEEENAALKQKIRSMEESQGLCSRFTCSKMETIHWLGSCMGTGPRSWNPRRCATRPAAPLFQERFACGLQMPPRDICEEPRLIRDHRSFEFSAQANTPFVQPQRQLQHILEEKAHLEAELQRVVDSKREAVAAEDFQKALELKRMEEELRERLADGPGEAGPESAPDEAEPEEEQPQAQAESSPPILGGVMDEELAGTTEQEHSVQPEPNPLQAPASLSLVHMQPRDVCSWDEETPECMCQQGIAECQPVNGAS